MQDGKRGIFRVRLDGFMREIEVREGCALYVTNELLQEEHAHGIAGTCLSHVFEVSYPSMPAPPSHRRPDL